MRRTEWHGTGEEGLELLHALREYCNCEVQKGHTVAPCAGHDMLARDQRAIDGLLFARRLVVRLLAEEFETNVPHVVDLSTATAQNPQTVIEFQLPVTSSLT